VHLFTILLVEVEVVAVVVEKPLLLIGLSEVPTLETSVVVAYPNNQAPVPSQPKGADFLEASTQLKTLLQASILIQIMETERDLVVA
jgi:hypothetical protein